MLTILKYSSKAFDILQPILLLLGIEKKGLVGLYTYIYGSLLGYSSTLIKAFVAQSAIETTWFSSQRFVEYNNAFGMRQPSVRETTATGTWDNHATYSGIASSVIDFYLRQSYFNSPKDGLIKYLQFLVASNYATGANYTNLITAVLNTSEKRIDDVYRESSRAAIYLGSLIAAGVFAYIKFKK